MYRINIRRMLLLAVAMFGAAMISGCSSMNSNAPYRVYYQDRSTCQIFYINNLGNRVNTGVYHKRDFKWAHVNSVGDRDGNYVDSMGNRVYRERVCN